jgi:phenylacetate-CoA ligase
MADPNENEKVAGDDELLPAQLTRLQLMLKELIEKNSFYRCKLNQAGLTVAGDLQELADYRALPFTEKDELILDQEEHPPYGSNLTFPIEHYVRLHQTSGTTGNPLVVLDTQESWGWWADCWATVYRAAGVTAADRVFFGFSFGPFIGFWSAFAGANKIGALTIPAGGMSSQQRINAIARHRPTVLVCTPTYALHLAEVARENGIDPANSSIRITIQAGEPGASLPAVKRRIEEAWGAECFDHAGASEVGAWGFEGRDHYGMRLNKEQFIFEVLDPVTHQPAQEGELVITNLGRVCMPVIRYRTGDRVKTKCASDVRGNKFTVLDGGIIGRIDDLLVIRGVNVYPSAIENVLRKFPEVGEFAVDIYNVGELDELEIRLEVIQRDPAALAAAVTQDLRDKLSLRVTVKPVPFGSLPLFDLKARRFTDHRVVASTDANKK